MEASFVSGSLLERERDRETETEGERVCDVVDGTRSLARLM